MTKEIIDCHQHFWQLSRGDYGWLTADLPDIYRDFLPSDLSPTLKKHNVSQTILVQAAPSFDESLFLLRLAEQHNFIAGIVAWIDMNSEHALKQLEQLSSSPHVKSIRPMIQDIDDIDWMLQARHHNIYQALIENQTAFDALVLPQHLDNLIILAERHPELTIIINHGAKPDIEHQAFENWSKKISVLGTKHNVYCKLSGLLTEAAPNASLEDLRPYMQHLLNSFGSEKLLWGSDWPVLNLASNYAIWLNMVKEFIAPLSASEQFNIMSNNAAKVYQTAMKI